MFLKSLCSTVERKFDNRFPSYYRTVSSDLYSLRAVPSHITVELFADCLNESGILHDYCSVEKRDSIFCAIGTWEEVEEIIEGAGGNAQFETCIAYFTSSIEELVILSHTADALILPLAKKRMAL